MARVLKVVLICAALGIGVFLFTVSQVTDIQKVGSDAAAQRFRDAVSQFEDTTPMLSIDGSGNVSHHKRAQNALIPAKPIDLKILAWQGGEVGLVSIDIPIWFLRLKGPALRYMLRDTGLDPARWDLSVGEIEAYGPGVVLDHSQRGGRRVLIWSE